MGSSGPRDPGRRSTVSRHSTARFTGGSRMIGAGGGWPTQIWLVCIVRFGGLKQHHGRQQVEAIPTWHPIRTCWPPLSRRPNVRATLSAVPNFNSLLVLLCHKRRVSLASRVRMQHGHRGSCLASARAMSFRIVDIELEVWRSSRSGVPQTAAHNAEFWFDGRCSGGDRCLHCSASWLEVGAAGTHAGPERHAPLRGLGTLRSSSWKPVRSAGPYMLERNARSRRCSDSVSFMRYF